MLSSINPEQELPHSDPNRIPDISELMPCPEEIAEAVLDPWAVNGFQDAISGHNQTPPWVIEDLLLEDSATLVSAQPHAMKSLSLLQASLEAVTTGKVWGHFKAQNVRSTLFIETEDPLWMVEARVRGLAKGLGISESDKVPGFHYACVGPFDLTKEESRIRNLVHKYRPDFMVLSTLQNLLFERDWKNQQDMQPVMAEIIRLSREAPIMLVTHSPWDKRQKRAAGSVTQAANFLTNMHYEKKRNKKTGETFVHVSVDSKAGALETSFSLRLEVDGEPRDPAGVRKLAYAGEGWPKGLTKDAIVAELEADPDATVEEIAERAQCSKRWVQRVLAKQKKEGTKAA